MLKQQVSDYFAINKVDKQNANPRKIKELAV
jgi:uncharacterized protein (DUF1015 family)